MPILTALMMMTVAVAETAALVATTVGNMSLAMSIILFVVINAVYLILQFQLRQSLLTGRHAGWWQHIDAQSNLRIGVGGLDG